MRSATASCTHCQMSLLALRVIVAVKRGHIRKESNVPEATAEINRSRSFWIVPRLVFDGRTRAAGTLLRANRRSSVMFWTSA